MSEEEKEAGASGGAGGASSAGGAGSTSSADSAGANPGAAPAAGASGGAGGASSAGGAGANPGATPTASSGAGELSAKRRGPSKKARMTLGVVVAIIVVAGAGFWVWHEQPSFCNAICHDPMDPYVESYDSGNPAYAVTAHAEAGENCLSCHEAVLTDQVSEAMAWVADDFEMTEEGMLAYDYGFATEEFCARSGCHNMDEVTAETWGFEDNDAKYNPHSSHQDLALECGDCHKAHQTSVLVCNDCHDLNAPEGWEG